MVERLAIRNALLDGVKEANRRYEKWSRGSWLSDSGVEGHVVSTICETLHGLIADKGSIEMEMSFRYIQEWSNAETPRGRPPTSQNALNRADIVILTREWRPVWVIEVKRVWNERKCLRDLVRIRDLIRRCGRRRNGTLKSGFLAFQLEASEEEEGKTAEQCLKEQAQEIKRVLDGFDRKDLEMKYRQGTMRHYPRRFRDLHDEPDWVHASFCVGLWSR